MDVDVLLRNAGNLRGAEARLLRALIADPDVDAIVRHQHRRVARFHARAGQIRRRVGGLDDLRGAREAGVHVALVDAHAARLVDGGHQRVAHHRGVDGRVLGRDRPLDRHAIERRLRLVPGVGDDRHAAAEDAAAGARRIRNRELHGGPHAWHGADGVEVVALHVAAVDRARLDRGPLHARQADVDPVDGLPRHLERHVEVLLLGAHQRPLIRRLDGDRLRTSDAASARRAARGGRRWSCGRSPRA